MTTPSRRGFFRLLAAASLSGITRGAAAGPASPWTRGYKSRARLLAGAGPDGSWLAGIEIALDGGFKTYWRHPGESGLPPAFDWAGSANLSRAEVLWPAPARFEDASGVSYGYADGVVLPVAVTPERPGEPVALSLALDYGVCKDICIPARAVLSLALPARPERPDPLAARTLARALARVPRRTEVGASGEAAVLAVEPVPGADALAVRVRAPRDAAPALFVEAPAGWYLAARAVPETRSGDEATFRVDVLERPPGEPRPVRLVLTLAAGDRSVEALADLDAALRPR